MKLTPQHIGIVACSAEGAALCYKTICVEGAGLLGPHAHPEVSMQTHSLADYVTFLDRDDWRGVGNLMLGSAHKLAKIGADFLICPDNTIHQALPYVEPHSPLPWLHIAEIVAAEAVARGFRRLGLTGTRWLVESDVYPEKLSARGLICLRPNAAERAETNRIIMDELVCEIFKPEAVGYFQRVIARMKEEGCDAVILGCTEIPLIINDGNSPLPTLDSTRLLARAALQHAGAPEAGSGMTPAPLHIGIAACTAEGAALCYKTICVEGARLLGPHAHPEVSLHGFSLADYMVCFGRGDWQGVAALMLGSAEKLAKMGADFLICPANLPHEAMPFVEARSPLPWLHIADVVAAEAAARGLKRLAITGTRTLVESAIYPERLAARGLDCLQPSPAERAECNRIIFEELIRSMFKPDSVAFLQRMIGRLKDEGADAVILGCTEFPLVLNDGNSPLPTLDSTRLLARAALRRAVRATTA